MASENRVDWPAHASIANESGPVLEDLFVRGLHVSVGAENRRDPTIKITAKGNFLTGGFAMGINDDVGRFTAHLLHRYVEDRERVFQDWMHEGARLHIDHAHLSFGRFQNDRPCPGRAGRIIERPQETRLGFKERLNLLAIPNMVAGGDDRSARPQQIDGDPRCNAATGGGVFAVYDDEIERPALLQIWQTGDDGVATWFAHDVAKKKNRQHGSDDRIKLENPKLMFRIFVTCGLALLLFASLPAARAFDRDAAQDTTASLSALGRAPDWSELEKYQSTITRDDFIRLLEHVYCPRGYDPDLITVEPDLARILTTSGTQDYFVLHFAKDDSACLPPKHSWTSLDRPLEPVKGKPLAGLHIALDPGHLGGQWAKMEERWFKIGRAEPVREGDMTLRVARMLRPQLESLGAKVTLLRTAAEPLTSCRPLDFEETARLLLVRQGITEPREYFDGPTDPEKEQTVAWQRELLFYRNSEIRSRADLVNDQVRPDLVLCLHFNAEPWGDPDNPELVTKNHLHLLVNGAYLPNELKLDDDRFEMLQKLLSRSYTEELGLADSIASAMVENTGLPPYRYTTDNATAVGKSGYVYARNLMATRLYRCPTVYLEPYVMNSHEVFARVKAGNYEGRKRVAGRKRLSIYREYAVGVVQGVQAYLRQARAAHPDSKERDE